MTKRETQRDEHILEYSGKGFLYHSLKKGEDLPKDFLSLQEPLKDPSSPPRPPWEVLRTRDGHFVFHRCFSKNCLSKAWKKMLTYIEPFMYKHLLKAIFVRGKKQHQVCKTRTWFLTPLSHYEDLKPIAKHTKTKPSITKKWENSTFCRYLFAPPTSESVLPGQAMQKAWPAAKKLRCAWLRLVVFFLAVFLWWAVFEYLFGLGWFGFYHLWLFGI